MSSLSSRCLATAASAAIALACSAGSSTSSGGADASLDHAADVVGGGDAASDVAMDARTLPGGTCGTAMCLSGQYCETIIPGVPCPTDDAGHTQDCSSRTCKMLPAGCADCSCLGGNPPNGCQADADGFLRVTVAGA
jgi:hypothetical protein